MLEDNRRVRKRHKRIRIIRRIKAAGGGKKSMRKKIIGGLFIVAIAVSVLAMATDVQAQTVDTQLGGLRTISVTVTEADGGLAMSGVSVTLYDSGDNAIISAITDANGTANFTGVLSGSYSVEATKSDYYDTSKDITVVASDVSVSLEMEEDFVNDPLSSTNLTYGAAALGVGSAAAIGLGVIRRR